MTESSTPGAITSPLVSGDDSGAPTPRRHVNAKLLGMAATTAFVTANIWTGVPVLALWIGSRFVGEHALSMAAVGIVVVVLAIVEFSLVLLLAWLNNTYDDIAGRPRVERRSRWLRSMRAEDEGYVSQRVGLTALEVIVMVNVYVAVLTLIVWYIFFAGAPAPTLCPTGTAC
jgi:hypothetical protein